MTIEGLPGVVVSGPKDANHRGTGVNGFRLAEGNESTTQTILQRIGIDGIPPVYYGASILRKTQQGKRFVVTEPYGERVGHFLENGVVAAAEALADIADQNQLSVHTPHVVDVFNARRILRVREDAFDNNGPVPQTIFPYMHLLEKPDEVILGAADIEKGIYWEITLHDVPEFKEVADLLTS